MTPQRAAPAVVTFGRYLSRPLCPRCGNEQIVPEHSEFAGEGRISHTWACEPCGHEFRTAIEFGRLAA